MLGHPQTGNHPRHFLILPVFHWLPLGRGLHWAPLLWNSQVCPFALWNGSSHSHLNSSFTNQFFDKLHYSSLYSIVFLLFKCLFFVDFFILFLDIKEDRCCFFLPPKSVENFVVIFDIVLLCFLKPNCLLSILFSFSRYQNKPFQDKKILLLYVFLEWKHFEYTVETCKKRSRVEKFFINPYWQEKIQSKLHVIN